MSLGSGALVLIAIWCTIHLLSYLTSHKSSILPNFQLRKFRRHTRVSLHFLHLKISTTSWNTYHDALSSSLSRRGKYRIVNALLKLTYNLGTILGALGILVAVVVLLWTCTSSAWILLQKMRGSTGTLDISHLMKRTIPETSKTHHPSSPYLGITPVVSQAFSLSYV